MASTELCIVSGRDQEKFLQAREILKKSRINQTGLRKTIPHSLNPLTISLIHIIHSWAKPDWLVLYQQTASEELARLF